MSDNYTDFKEIVRDIESKKIILPDFQREFVWRDEEQQKKIVASVLARMPIGSVLLLKSKPNEYSSKQIGCKNPVDPQLLNKEVEFLLDGQQRITVLTNVFSNIIHDQCPRVSDLISPSLKRRFFLRIPKWVKCRAEADLFGVRNLEFSYQIPDSEDPKFLSGDIMPFIECIQFLADDDKPYNPKKELSVDLDNFCLTYEKGYLIPLFLIAPPEKKKKSQYIRRYKAIIEKITSNIGEEIVNYYEGLKTKEDQDTFVDEIIDDETIRKEIKDGDRNFDDEIDNKVDVWTEYLKQHLEL